jgi:hypothetical protein
MRRLQVLASATVRFAVAVAILAAVVAVPLVVIYRSHCDGEIRYNVVPPWNDPPKECTRHQSGLDLLRKEVGID